MIRNSRYALNATPCEINNGISKTIQGDAQSVYELFQKMVLGQYLPSSPIDSEYDYDTREGEVDLDSVDDKLNRLSFTPEEAYQLQKEYANIGLSEYQNTKTPLDPSNLPSEPPKSNEGTEV